MRHLEEVLLALRMAGFTVKFDKCEFGRSKIEYLGHWVGSGILAVPKHRTSTMKNFAKPRTQKQLRSFLGSMNYYRKFIPGYAKLSAKLTPATSKNSPVTVQWTQDMESAFCELKNVLCDVTVLHVPLPGDVFSLHTDASGDGIGAVLNIERDEGDLPVSFYSRQLRGAETNYSVTELETLAIISSIEHFICYLWGRQFKVFTDHKPCISLMRSRTLNRRLRRMALKLQEFQPEIVYRPGSECGNADGLSRQAWQPHQISDAHKDHLSGGRCGAIPR